MTTKSESIEPAKAATKGRIKHSIVPWCFELFGEKWSLEKTCQVAAELGCASVELVKPEHYPLLSQYGLTCALGFVNMDPDPPFIKGFNNPAYWPRVVKATEDSIDAAAAFGTPSVIAFTGYSYRNADDPNSGAMSREEGAQNCVDGLKKVIRRAEEKNITLCLEMLNTRDDSTPMNGHPGYQGDDIEWCVDIINRVGSPRLKLLFDIYHVQIMHGDVIHRIRQHRAYLGHIHTAGVPGRHELDDIQEVNYRGVMQALLEVGYTGYVGHEFIPTRNPLEGLRQAVTTCDV